MLFVYDVASYVFPDLIQVLRQKRHTRHKLLSFKDG